MFGVVGIIVRNGTVYWTNDGNGKVVKVPAGGGRLVVLASGTNPTGIAVDDSNVYWTDAAGTVQRVPIEGGESTVLATNQSLPSELAIDGSNIYWINSVVDGAVMKLAK